MKLNKILAASIAALAISAGAAFAQEIQIAVVGPMTGQLATIGDQFKQGAEAAAKAINDKGGVAGKQIKIVIEDDVCDPKQAVSVANRIVANGIKFVDGHACSGSSIPASVPRRVPGGTCGCLRAGRRRSGPKCCPNWSKFSGVR